MNYTKDDLLLLNGIIIIVFDNNLVPKTENIITLRNKIRDDIKIKLLHEEYAELLSQKGPLAPKVQSLGKKLALQLGYHGEGMVDRVTHEALDKFVRERFNQLDPETQKLVIANMCLKLSD